MIHIKMRRNVFLKVPPHLFCEEILDSPTKLFIRMDTACWIGNILSVAEFVVNFLSTYLSFSRNVFQNKVCNFVTEVRLLSCPFLNTILLICLDPANTNEKKRRLYLLTVSPVRFISYVYSTLTFEVEVPADWRGRPFSIRSEK